MTQGESTKGRVLLADDDESIRMAYARRLRGAGFEVETAGDGDTAARMARGAAFDVIVTDLSMPGMSGLDLLAAVREHDREIPVVFITGVATQLTAVEAAQLGALRYLMKPIPEGQLEMEALRAVELHQNMRRASVTQSHPVVLD